jgi:hypothetical protein
MLVPASLTALSFIGTVSFPYSFHLLSKTKRDIEWAHPWNHRWIVVLSINQDVEIISNLVLTSIGWLASVTGLTGLGSWFLKNGIRLIL